MSWKTALLCTLSLCSISLSLYSKQEKTALKILYFVDPPSATQAVINAGKKQGMHEGQLLSSYRVKKDQHSKSVLIPTGLLKVVFVRSNSSFVQVVGTPLTSYMNSKRYPKGPMAGDQVQIKNQPITKSLQILPQLQFKYSELFLFPSKDANNFELSANGQQELTETAKIFEGKYIGKLLISAYTDSLGDWVNNRIESQKRASIIRNYLITEFNFDPKRVIAIGMGEVEYNREQKMLNNSRYIIIKGL